MYCVYSKLSTPDSKPPREGEFSKALSDYSGQDHSPLSDSTEA